MRNITIYCHAQAHGRVGNFITRRLVGIKRHDQQAHMLEAGCPIDYGTCGSWGNASCHEYLNPKDTQPLAPDPADQAARHHQSSCDEVAHTAACLCQEATRNRMGAEHELLMDRSRAGCTGPQQVGPDPCRARVPAAKSIVMKDTLDPLQFCLLLF